MNLDILLSINFGIFQKEFLECINILNYKFRVSSFIHSFFTIIRGEIYLTQSFRMGRNKSRRANDEVR